jgi:transcriptional regulator
VVKLAPSRSWDDAEPSERSGRVAPLPISLGDEMYVPTHFKEDRLAVLHDAIRQAGLATLVTGGPEGLDASHVPMLLDLTPAPFGTLFGHIARANPQWRGAAPDLQALAIFLGPDAYITPSWYATKRQTGEVVPTWNYVAVHAHGRVRFFDDPERLLGLVTKLTEAHEAGRPRPWAVSDAPGQYIRAHLAGIVGFELPIARLEGKWKMSQNRSTEDRAGAADGLDLEGDTVVAAIVRTAGRH